MPKESAKDCGKPHAAKLVCTAGSLRGDRRLSAAAPLSLQPTKTAAGPRGLTAINHAKGGDPEPPLAAAQRLSAILCFRLKQKRPPVLRVDEPTAFVSCR